MAATPPGQAQAGRPHVGHGAARLGDQHVDDGLLEGGRDVLGGGVGVPLDGADDRGLEAREGEVVAVGEQRPREGGTRSGSPRARGPVEGRATRDSRGRGSGPPCRRPRRPRRRASGRGAGSGRGRPRARGSCGRPRPAGRRAASGARAARAARRTGGPPGGSPRRSGTSQAMDRALAPAQADEQGADEPGPVGDGDRPPAPARRSATPASLEGLGDDPGQPLEVGPAGQLGHHTAVARRAGRPGSRRPRSAPSRPRSTTAAAVSSHEVSMPSTRSRGRRRSRPTQPATRSMPARRSA